MALTVILTNRCNLRCGYCYFFSNENACGAGEMPLTKVIDIIQEAGRAGVMQVNFSGGEALLRPDFREIVRCVVDNRMRFSLQTNGILCDRSMAGFLASTGRCDFVKISVDGRREIHDAVRGKGSHDAAMAAVGNVLDAGLPCIVTASVNRCHLPEFEAELDYLLNIPGTPFVSCGAVVDCANADSYALTDDMCREAIKRLAAVEKGNEKRLLSRGMVGGLRSWRKMYLSESGGETPPEGTPLCPSVNRSLGVCSDGRWQVCKLFPEINEAAGGTDLPLLDYWRNSAFLKELREPAAAHIEPDSPCAGCRYVKYCPWAGGGCYIIRKYQSDRNYYCLRRFLEQYGREGLGI